MKFVKIISLMIILSFWSCEPIIVYTPFHYTPVHSGSKWKLVGWNYMDSKSKELRVLEPKDCEECFTLTFILDYVAIVRSINEKMIINLLKLNPDPEVVWNIWCERYDKDDHFYSDGDDLRLACETVKGFIASKNKLILFTINDEFWVFKKN